MLNKLKELVFGLEEFEKTKIDVRYELISSMISSLQLNEISDFEILEDCISKIKDQLRVKSSNLNKIISDPSKKLKKRDVKDVLDRLSKVKYDFLEKAFNLIQKDNSVFDELKSNAHELDSRIDNFEKKQDMPTDIKEENKSVFENDYLKVRISNGRVPYIIVDFYRDVDYGFLKTLSGYLFEEYSASGTNIIVENNKCIVVPRFDNDNLFEIPRIDVDIDEVLKKINERDFSKKKYDDEPNSSIHLKEKESAKKKDVEADYVEIDSKPAEFKTKKFEEDSLDAILMGAEKSRVTPKPKPSEDESNVSFEKDDAIELEKKKEEIKEPEVEIEFKEKKNENLSEPADKDKYISADQEKSQAIEDTNVEVTEILPQKSYEMYRDDKIVAYLKESSKVLGELIIEPLSGNINESDFSYMWIFSKIFSSVLFEVTQSAGTNILMDYSNNIIRIIPREQDDGLNLLWTPKQESDEFLEQIKDKLLKVLSNALDNKKPEDIKERLEVAKEDKDTIIQEKDVEDKPKTKEMTSKEKKANHLIEHLRKIP